MTRLFGRDSGDHPAPTVEDLKKGIEQARSGSVTAADHLASLLLAIDRAGDTVRADIALRALSEESPQTWLVLDIATRRSDWMPAPAWADEVRTRFRRRSLSALGVGLATFHPNGFIREEAVQQLIASPTALTMPFVVIRTADWVSQVRTQAQRGLTSLLETPSAEYIAAIAPLAATLTRRKRGSFALDVARVAIERGGEETVRVLLAQRDARTRRLALTAAVDQAVLSIDELVRLGVGDPDPVCRLLAAESVHRDATGDVRTPALLQLLGSTTARVRTVALTGLGELGRTDVVRECLGDPSSNVRDLAQHLVRQQGSDPAEFYRRVLDGGASPSAAVLAGLGETGNAGDTHLVMPWLTHPKPRLRAEAVRALRRLGDVPVDDLIPMLTDISPKVVRQVVTALQRRAGLVPQRVLADLLEEGKPRHVRVGSFRLLHERDLWARLESSLTLINDPDEVVCSLARADIDAWLWREAPTSYSQPKGEAAERLSRAIDGATFVLGREKTRRVRFYLGLLDA